MEKRHFEIRDRAGLEESRLNQDFVDFLKKWGTPILLVIALIATGYNFYMRHEQSKEKEVGDAFGALNAASGSFTLDRINWGVVDVDQAGVPQDANPEGLIAVADQYKDIAGVSNLARLTAADGLLRTIRTGVKPGSLVRADGVPANADDLLTADQRTANLNQAEELYNKVLTDARSKAGSVITQMNAIYGLAAVAECRGKFDEAKTQYEAVIKLVDQTPFAAHVAVAKNRIAGLESLKTLPTLLAKADIPRIPGLDPEPQPVTPPAPAPGTEAPAVPAPGAAGTTPPTPPAATPGTEPPAAAPAPTPTPAPAPAPTPTPAPTTPGTTPPAPK